MSVPCLKMLAQFGYVIEYLRNVQILDIAIFDLFFCFLIVTSTMMTSLKYVYMYRTPTIYQQFEVSL